MFVNGQAMSGGTLSHALVGAQLVRQATSAARYRFYSVRDEFPGMVPVDQDGVSVPGELYEVDYAVLRDKLLPNEPVELELTVIDLEDGSGALCMKMRHESLNLPGVIDISSYGGWRAYLAEMSTS